MPKIWDQDGNQDGDYEIIEHTGEAIDKAQESKHRGLGANIGNVVGLCAQCMHYQYAENDVHQVVISLCTGFNYGELYMPVGKQKIENCTNFSQRGQLSVRAMFGMATLIDPGEFTGKRRTAGFTSEELKEKK